jgi:hypothetical protein
MFIILRRGYQVAYVYEDHFVSNSISSMDNGSHSMPAIYLLVSYADELFNFAGIDANTYYYTSHDFINTSMKPHAYSVHFPVVSNLWTFSLLLVVKWSHFFQREVKQHSTLNTRELHLIINTIYELLCRRKEWCRYSLSYTTQWIRIVAIITKRELWRSCFWSVVTDDVDIYSSEVPYIANKEYHKEKYPTSPIIFLAADDSLLPYLNRLFM